jgi:hypothetical protein
MLRGHKCDVALVTELLQLLVVLIRRRCHPKDIGFSKDPHGCRCEDIHNHIFYYKCPWAEGHPVNVGHIRLNFLEDSMIANTLSSICILCTLHRALV